MKEVWNWKRSKQPGELMYITVILPSSHLFCGSSLTIQRRKLQMAMTFPFELILVVLDFLIPSVHSRCRIPPTSKRHLSKVSLVCKLCADQFRPILFRTIQCRSHSDVNDLLEFVSSPKSLIQNYVLCIELEQSPLSYVWIHIALSLLLSRLPRLTSVSFLLPSNATAADETILFPPYVWLRTRPAFPSQSIIKLVLDGYRFPTFSVLSQIIRSMSGLQEVHCKRVSWGSGPLEPRHNSRSRTLATRCLRLITASSCPMQWDLLQLFPAGEYSNRKQGLSLPRGEVSAIAKLAQHLLGDLLEDIPEYYTCFEVTQGGQFHPVNFLSKRFLFTEGLTCRRTVTHSAKSLYSPIFRANTANEASGRNNVTSVDVSRCTLLHLHSYDWGIINEALRELPYLNSFHLSCSIVRQSFANSLLVDYLSNRIQDISIFTDFIETGVYGNTTALLVDLAYASGRENYLHILGENLCVSVPFSENVCSSHSH